MRATVIARQRSRKAQRSRADAISLAKDVRASVDSARPMRPEKSAPLSNTPVVRNGLMCVLSVVHYAVSGSIGPNARSLSPKIITRDTGSRYALIRKLNLPSDWERYVIEGAATPKLADANGHALKIEAMVHLTTRLGNSIYRLRYLVVESLAVDVILATAFMNEHVDHICYREQMIGLHKGSTIPLLTASEVFPQRRKNPCGDDGAPSSADPDSEKHVYDDTAGRRARPLQNTHSLRLATRIRLPPMSQTAVRVTTGARELCFPEPKLTFQARNNIRLANGVVEIEDGSRFQVLLSNFSKFPRRLPKGAVLGYAVRDPVAIIAPQRKLAEQCGEVLNITNLPARGQGRSELSDPSREKPTLDPPDASPQREPGIVATTKESGTSMRETPKKLQPQLGTSRGNGKTSSTFHTSKRKSCDLES